MKKTLQIVLIAVLALVLAGSMFYAGYSYARTKLHMVEEQDYAFLQQYNNDATKQLLESAKSFDLLFSALQYADTYFYEDLDYDALDKALAVSLISDLDDYSLMSAAALSGSSTTQEAVGITVKSTKYNRHYVSYVEPSSAAYGVLQRGDRLVAVSNSNNTSGGATLVDGLSKSYLSSVFQGGAGTIITLSVVRDGALVEGLQIEKKIVKVNTAQYTDNLGGTVSDDLGYIRLTSFSSGADSQFMSAIVDFFADDNQALILDLRDNPGGLASVMCSIGNYLLTNGEDEAVPMIEFFRAYDNTNVIEYARHTSQYIDKPIYVLMGEGSASASEALISAISYYETGVLIGDVTYGKGVGQSTVENAVTDNDGAKYAISVTTGKYYVYTKDTVTYPEGKYCIDGEGISPDYPVTPDKEFYDVLSEDPCIQKANELFIASRGA